MADHRRSMKDNTEKNAAKLYAHVDKGKIIVVKRSNYAVLSRYIVRRECMKGTSCKDYCSKEQIKSVAFLFL